MIQRAQSIYLFAVTVLMSILLVVPMVELIVGDEIFILYGYGLKLYEGELDQHIFTAYPMLILIVLIAGISFVNIFFFRKRFRQLRLCVLNILLMIGLVVMMFFYYRFIKKEFDVGYDNFKIGAVFPILTIILTFLAFRGIRADEILVRSYDRLR